jgi:hypothetical protein
MNATKICSVVIVFLAMVMAATVPMRVLWLWLLLPLLFLISIEAGSSSAGFAKALMSPRLWLFYGGLVAMALLFEFQGLHGGSKANAPTPLAMTSMPHSVPSQPGIADTHFRTLNSNPGPATAMPPTKPGGRPAFTPIPTRPGSPIASPPLPSSSPRMTSTTRIPGQPRLQTTGSPPRPMPPPFSPPKREPAATTPPSATPEPGSAPSSTASPSGAKSN